MGDTDECADIALYLRLCRVRRRFSGCDKNAEKNRKQKTTEFFDKLEESVLIRKSVSKMIMNLKNDTQIH